MSTYSELFLMYQSKMHEAIITLGLVGIFLVVGWYVVGWVIKREAIRWAYCAACCIVYMVTFFYFFK